MQKILFVITKSNWGGAQRYVFDLARSLPKQEWNVGVVLGGTGLPGAGGGRLEEELRHKDIRTLFVPSFMRDFSLGAEWRTFKHLSDLFATEQPDIVHLNSSKAGGLGAVSARLAGVPMIVFTVHGAPWQEDRGVLARGVIAVASWITFLFCHRVIVISQDAFERIRALPFCGSKARLVHNGIEPLEFLSKEAAREELSGRFNLGSHELRLNLPAPWVGAVGELVWNKGYHVLLRAIGVLKRRGINAYVCIAGDGEERKFIETLIQEEDIEDRVHLAGFVQDAYKILKAFDIFVLPSVKEGLPYVLIEAGQAELPIVATRVGGVPDLITDNVSGLLCPPKNHSKLADRLAELLGRDDMQKKFAGALHERALKEFSLQKMIEQTAAVYRNS